MFGPIKRKPKEKEDPAEKQREQEETARVYAEFVKSFQVEENLGNKKFVRGGILDPNKTLTQQNSTLQDDTATQTKFSKSSKKTLWVPSTAESLQARQSLSRASSLLLNTTPSSSSENQTTLRTELGKGIGGLDGITETKTVTSGQRTREIDTFLEEIKRKQLLVNQRKQLRHVAANVAVENTERETAQQKLDLLDSQTKGRGSIPGVVEAEETTNLYLGNLSPEITEEFLCQQFGKYGHITSVKIMYPRSDEERARRRHCGFVSFKNRDMAEAAKNALDGEEFFNMPIRIGWGKAVSRPNLGSASVLSSVAPTAVTPSPLPAMILPCPKPPVSGFSDTPPEKTESDSSIHVYFPENPYQKHVIDVVAQYVLEDGYALEQFLIENEEKNDLFKFLTQPDSKLADYYRWRIYSLAQGDTLKSWRVEPYYMFTVGQKWHPPQISSDERKSDKRQSNFSSKAEVALLSTSADSSGERSKNSQTTYKGTRRLDEERREELENHLRHLTRERSSIQTVMAFCLDHSEYALEISECLMESLTIEKTPLDTKIARLYLLSDILYNLSSSRQPAWSYRSALQRYLPEIFNHHNRVLKSLTGKLTIEAMKVRVMSVLRIWEDWAIYPPLFTKGLEANFLKEDKLLQDVFSSAVTPADSKDDLYDAELDGTCLEDFSTLAKFPFWIRESVREWNALDLSHLEALCFRRGLSVSPEPIPEKGFLEEDQAGTRLEKGVWDEKNIGNQSHPRFNVSYSDMRQLLIKRLVECEAYWRNRQAQNAKAFQILDLDHRSTTQNIPSSA